MAGHKLIDGYLATLAQRLPAPVVAELADGLTETYHHHRADGLDPHRAARAAITEFGDPDTVIASFVRHSPGRRTARALLVWGPTVGLCWGVALVSAHAWTWPVPPPLRLAFGVTLLAVVACLALAATAARSYRRARLGPVGGAGLLVLDAGMLTMVALLRPAFGWPLALAVAASLARMAFVSRHLPRPHHG